MAQTERIEIAAADARLAGRLVRPAGSPLAAAVIHAATGVPARFYCGFADWLAETRGVACLTYDYRDFGQSGSARGSRATMADWGIRDQQAARATLAAALPDVPLWVIGHSLGGMMLPFQSELGRIDRVVTVAAGAVHVTDHPWPARAAIRAFWSRPVLGLTRALGHLPAARFGIGHDLPAGVYAQWRLWCTSRGFHAADPTLPAPDAAALTCPVRMVAVADDAYCPPVSVERLAAAYPAARMTRVLLRPGEVGMRRIGHLDVLGARGRACWDAVTGPA
ncbi:alpha/beta hydrolase family protein [Jannaschia ovalis]|uniref:Alpha/beta fold hydrolase n=1 Tax=Jannaschia ovalis TaxID=3038773 RepID=A0ABY8LH72_9RHOB|nr:alpha/beta fold hydrolase [Jannaschia sp. GRR-S6-38]WGH79490.1 alpha/beta fold hydrolase [Jannaschia sp. GRR-S6-38]